VTLGVESGDGEGKGAALLWEERAALTLPSEDAVSGRPVVLAAVHGILTGTDGRLPWPWRLEAWATQHAPDLHVLTNHYWMGPWPRWNYWRNLFFGAALGRRLAHYAECGYALHLAGHSNGACIALRACKELARAGHRVASLHFIGGAVHADVRVSGVLRLLRDDALGRVVNWWDASDAVLGVPWILRWPYGCAGRQGLRYGRQCADGPRIEGVRHHGYGHTGYFSRENEHRTFEGIARVAQL
jgi:hypothetical protein